VRVRPGTCNTTTTDVTVDSFDGKVSGQVSGVSQQQWHSQDSSNYNVLGPSGPVRLGATGLASGETQA
jgi:hypothetical protein